MDMTATQVLNLAIAADIVTAVTGALIGAEVELFTDDVLPTSMSVLADFTLATYDGYAAEAVTWLAPSVSDDGKVEIVGTVGEFRPTGATTPNDIFGFLITDGGGNLLYGGRFPDAPLPMNTTLDQIIVTPRARPLSTGVAEFVS